MGIDAESARFLIAGRMAGVSFERCATLGRQNYLVGKQETLGLLRDYGLDPEKYPKLLSERYSRFRYAESFYEMLGAKELEVIDFSDFEGAPITHRHDLNTPIPDELRGRYDAVCDFGTLEHVYNFPTGIRNCLELLKVGGHFFAQLPANNYFGHGFYQFSAELFFCIFSEQNGFRMEHMIAVDYGPRRRWYAVADPDVIKARVALVSSFPIMLMFRARKVAAVPLLLQPPHQSDCLAQWSKQATPAQSGVIDRFADPKLDRFKATLIEAAPSVIRFLEAFRFSAFNREWSLRNRRSFTPIKKRTWGVP